MRGLSQQLALGNPQPARDRVHPDDFGRGQRRVPRGAVAIGPRHVMMFLASEFYHVAQKAVLFFRQFHRSTQAGARDEVKAREKSALRRSRAFRTDGRLEAGFASGSNPTLS